MCKVAIIGYGKMGKEIEKVLMRANATIVAKIDDEKDWAEQEKDFLTADVAIEFSQPSVATANFYKCFDRNIPLVAGTTGWYDRLDEVVEHCRRTSGSFVYGTNFSIGVNLFFLLARQTAAMLGNDAMFEPRIAETHHIHKKDMPSGTAITLAETVLPLLPGKRKWVLNTAPQADELEIDACREGEVQGIHSLSFASPADEIELKHTAKSRAGFAFGAVKSALWLLQHPGIYNFKDIFAEVNNAIRIE